MKLRRSSAARYTDREDAGKSLASALLPVLVGADPIILALPRGGVPVGAIVADALGAPLDVVMVRKVGVPKFPELAMGAIASVGGRLQTVRNEHVLRDLREADAAFTRVASRETEELRRREAAYRGGLPELNVRGRTVVVVDDGVATGATMRAAIAALRSQSAERIVAAAPVFLGSARAVVGVVADDLVCPWPDANLPAVGSAYAGFTQVGDEEVQRLLSLARGRRLEFMTDYADLPEAYRAYLSNLDANTADALLPVLKQSVAGGEHGVLVSPDLGPDTQAEVSPEVPYGEIREATR